MLTPPHPPPFPFFHLSAFFACNSLHFLCYSLIFGMMKSNRPPAFSPGCVKQMSFIDMPLGRQPLLSCILVTFQGLACTFCGADSERHILNDSIESIFLHLKEMKVFLFYFCDGGFLSVLAFIPVGSVGSDRNLTESPHKEKNHHDCSV